MHFNEQIRDLAAWTHNHGDHRPQTPQYIPANISETSRSERYANTQIGGLTSRDRLQNVSESVYNQRYPQIDQGSQILQHMLPGASETRHAMKKEPQTDHRTNILCHISPKRSESSHAKTHTHKRSEDSGQGTIPHSKLFQTSHPRHSQLNRLKNLYSGIYTTKASGKFIIIRKISETHQRPNNLEYNPQTS